jgi:MFS family permease
MPRDASDPDGGARALARALLPATARPPAGRLVAARAVRGFADGFASVGLAAHLSALGYTGLEIGAIAAAALVGSAALTLGVGLAASRLAPRAVLYGATLLFGATGFGFAALSGFWPLLLLAFVGTLNPTGGDVSVFVPTEQALLAASAERRDHTALFARYNLGGALLGSLGALASALPGVAAARLGVPLESALRAGFAAYGAMGLALALLYRGAGRSVAAAPAAAAGPAGPLARSRRVVLELTALFSLDSFGGGFAVQSLVALWLFRRFDLPLGTVGAVFFAAGILTAFSQLASARLAARFGRVNTMVWTHLPANLFLVLAALMPSAGLAVTFLLLRMALSQMDVPARQSLVMALVPPEERAAAASVTNVPRALAAGLAPLLAGALLDASDVGWPLVVGGALKIAYDLLLLARFRGVEARLEAAGGGAG